MPKALPATPPQRRAGRAAVASPRYVWLHDCLLNDITSGKYLVGSLLPTEAQLGKTYGISQRTVRDATLMPADAAIVLHLPAGSPALRMLRCYFDQGGQLLTASVNLFMADRFRLVTSWNPNTPQTGE